MRRLALIEQQRRRLYAEPPPSPGMARLAALERVVAAQGERIAALEARTGFAAQRPPMQHGSALSKQIKELLERDAGPKHGTAKRVLRALQDTDIWRSEQPSLRAVQWHVTQLRKLHK